MFKLLEPVVLKIDVPERGLRKGLLGTVVEVYSPSKVEVEFVTASGRTIALLPLSTRDLRKPTDGDAIAVAPASRRKGEVIGPFKSPDSTNDSGTRDRRAAKQRRRPAGTSPRRRRSA